MTITDAPPIVNHGHLYYFGVLLALGVALFGGLANVSVAVCGRGIDSSVLVFYCGLICVPVGLVASSFDPNQRFISSHIVDIPAMEWGHLVLQSTKLLLGFTGFKNFANNVSLYRFVVIDWNYLHNVINQIGESDFGQCSHTGCRNCL